MVRKLLARLDVETQPAAIHYFVDEMTLEEVAAAWGARCRRCASDWSSVATLRGRWHEH